LQRVARFFASSKPIIEVAGRDPLGGRLTFEPVLPIMLDGMFGSLGIQEIVVILGLALIIFGPKKLPEIGKTLGRSLGEFRRATSDLKRSIQQEVDSIDDTPPESSTTKSKDSS